ncbi:tyrosine-protein kinase Src42A-like isoform X1 [Phthorimaea operculella]|nr:tyrosine-protein kinase Src42A-like isoform X1 [Phthorimaea operculella]
MVSEGALPVVWCMRDNQLVPHQVSGVKLQGAVTGAHIAAVTDFLRMVAGTQIVLPHRPVPEDVDNDINQEKESSTRRRKMSMQVEVPCVFLTESALQKAKTRSNSLDDKVLFDHCNKPAITKSYLEIDSKSYHSSSSNMSDIKESDDSHQIVENLKLHSSRESVSDNSTQRITRIIELDDLNPECNNKASDNDSPQRITRIIEFNKPPSPECPEIENEKPQRITRIIELNDDIFSITNTASVEKESPQRLSRIIELEKESSFPSMAKIIEMENEISNERRIALTNERETGGGNVENSNEDVIVRSKIAHRNTRFSLDSSCSENSYVNIECIKSLPDVRKEDISECGTIPETPPACRTPRSRFPKKKTSVCSIGSSDCDDEIDVIFKSKPKSSQWVSLDWIPPQPKEEPVRTDVCDKNDFITKWIAEQNAQDGIIADERRKSLPPKSNEVYLQNMRRFSDSLQICKEDAASDSPATVKWKWHDIVKRHLQLLKNDKGFRRQRGSWIRTARRLSTTTTPNHKHLDSLPLDIYMKLQAMP